MTTTLYLPLKAEYFDAIEAGEKPFEFRRANDHWTRRIAGRTYDRIVLTRGYPKGGGVEGETRLTRPWRKPHVQTITHPHFGPDPVEVYAIDVTLNDGLSYSASERGFVFSCRSCGTPTPWEGEVDDFDYEDPANLCGGSPWCLP